MASKKVNYARALYRFFHMTVLSKCSGLYFDDEQSQHEHYWMLTRLVSIGHATERMRVLDVGCGCGFFLARLRKKLPSCEPCGIDLANSALAIARKHSHLNLMRSTAERLPFRNGSFDAVVLQNLLHHLIGSSRQSSAKKAENTIRQIESVLKRDGHLVVIEQCTKSRFLSYACFLFSSVLALLGRQQKVSFLTPNELCEVFGTQIADEKKQSGAGIYRWFARLYIVCDNQPPEQQRNTANTRTG